MWSTILTNKKWQESVLFATLIMLASFLRFYLLPVNMPFIGDQAKDFFTAVDMVEKGKVPLLGIESSMPQFRQGPVYIWLLAFFFAIVGYSPENTSYLAASIGIMAVGALYIYSRKFFGRKTAFYATALLAVSPLAVAHSQLSFIINPIPLVSVGYLLSLLSYTRHSKRTLFWPSIWFGLLFQFELASASLILLLPIAFSLKKRPLKFVEIEPAIKGLIIGLLPQIIYDLTHQFKQLGLFAVWVGYRAVGFLGFKEAQAFSFERLTATLQTICTYLIKTVSWNAFLFSLLAAVLLYGFIIWLKLPKKLSSPSVLVWCWLLIVIVSYIVHGSPSEAYFPVLFVPLFLAMGWSLSQASSGKGALLAPFIIGVVVITNSSFIVKSQALSINASNSFDLPSNAWLPRYSTQLQVVEIVKRSTEGPIHLRSIGPGSNFPAFLDNFRYLFWFNGIELSQDGEPVWLVFGGEKDNLPFINMRSFKLDELTVSVPL